MHENMKRKPAVIVRPVTIVTIVPVMDAEVDAEVVGTAIVGADVVGVVVVGAEVVG